MQTINDLIRFASHRESKREAYVGADGRVTFGAAAERAWQLARGLRDAGYGRGDVVGVLATNTVFNAELFLGIAAAGNIYGAYNWRWAPRELADGIIESGARVVIAQDELSDSLRAALDIIEAEGEFAAPHVIEQGEVDHLRTGSGEFDAGVVPLDPLCLIFTGGSTGRSKAVVCSHQGAVVNGLNERIDVGLGALPDERGLMSTPMFHSAGLLCWLVTHLLAARTLVLLDKFTEEEFVKWVTQERVTNTFMIPNMMRRLQQSGALLEPGVQKHFRAMHTGAGLLQMPHKQDFIDALPNARLYYRYGLSEAGPIVTRLLHDDILDPSVDGSIGQEYTLTETKLAPLNGGEDDVAPGELGEILARGPGIMLGYFHRPEATAETIVNGWLHTGDVAMRDERGHYFFKDRLKEMIKSGGENVYCAEIEQILYTHPAVLEAAVLGAPNEAWGEEVRAVISLRKGQATTDVELANFLRARLAGYKVPKQFVFMEAEHLPRSGAGKLVKGELKSKLGWL